jgi:hypothetical protein
LTTCLNCGHSFKGKFCPACGQKAEVKRITFSVFTYEILHFFTHVEKGFLRTTIDFIIRPGNTSLNYLKGKRKSYQQPVSYFFIWIGLYILVHNFIINHNQFHIYDGPQGQLNVVDNGNILLRTHFSLFFGPILLISALIIYAILARPRFNFMEILTICLYGAGTYFMMLLVSDIILGLIFKINVIKESVFIYQTILSALYNFWFSFDLFKRVHLPWFWLRLIMVAMLISVVGLLLMNYLPILWMYLISKHE